MPCTLCSVMLMSDNVVRQPYNTVLYRTLFYRYLLITVGVLYIYRVLHSTGKCVAKSTMLKLDMTL